MKLIYSSIALYLFFVITVIAEIDHFISPGVNSQYSVGDTIPFLVDDMPDEDDLNINANLHKSDGRFVKTIKTWSSQDADENGEEFPFQWLVDVSEGGIYYVEIKVGTSRDEVTQSYPFTILSKDDPPTLQSNPVQEGDNPIPTLDDSQSSITESTNPPSVDPVQDEENPMPALDDSQSSIAESTTPLSSDTSTIMPSDSPITPPKKPEMTPGPSMEQLHAADDIAVAQEKASIAQQQDKTSSSSPPESPHQQHAAIKDQKSHLKLNEVLSHANAVDIANKVKAAAAINKAASIAHTAAKQKRNAYSQIQRNRSKFSKWNIS